MYLCVSFYILRRSIRRYTGHKKYDKLCVLSGAVRGHYVYDSDTTTNVILFFQFDCAVRADFVDGIAWIYTAAWFRRKTNTRYVNHVSNQKTKKKIQKYVAVLSLWRKSFLFFPTYFTFYTRSLCLSAEIRFYVIYKYIFSFYCITKKKHFQVSSYLTNEK